jgi:hypothetical protein
MQIPVWSNTRLDDERDWPVDGLVDLFLRSPWYRPDADPAPRLRMFLTDRDGPIRGVCDEAAMTQLTTAVHQRTGALVAAGQETA